MSKLEQAARDIVAISRWYHPVLGPITIPFPWSCFIHDGIVTVLAADSQVLMSDDTRECDPAFWLVLVAALNALAEEITL